ncbi:MAG: hypothetical protein WCP10_02130 [Desulfuromonadales bacterium]
MRCFIILLLFISMLQAGCSSVRVVPDTTTGLRINAADGSLTAVDKGVEIAARADETSISGYNLDSIITAFMVSIKNGSSGELAFSEDSFVLVDETGLQYSLLTPEKVREMLKKDSYYLMPYPYVGFYYLEDYQKTSFYNRFNSSLPYYYELYPQDLFTKSLSMTTVIPDMKIEGLVYFKIDPAMHQAFKLLVYRKGASKSSPPDFTLPFKIVK